MISHVEFKKLKLKQFFPGKEVEKLGNWEFMENKWVGEAIGFSEWLCLNENPNDLGSLSLELTELPEEGYKKVLKVLGLSLKKGMSIEEIENILGKSNNYFHFVDDRKTYEFLYGKDELYYISCTVLNNGGLIYLLVMSKNANGV